MLCSTPAVAKAAAVMRSAYMSDVLGGPGNAADLDLSSNRVRLANWMIDATRNKHSLGQILGYRLIRIIQDKAVAEIVSDNSNNELAELPRYIPELRLIRISFLPSRRSRLATGGLYRAGKYGRTSGVC